MSGCVNACDCCYQVEKLEEEIAKLNSPVLLSEWQKLQRENEALREALREIRDSDGTLGQDAWMRQRAAMALKEVGDE
jgi:hypothetical protein